jgi:hypothetical protein
VVPEQAALFDDGSAQSTVPVRLKGIRIERSRQFGDVYLALALWRGTGLEELCWQLLPAGQERIGWAKMAAVLVAARFCEPSSELHIAEDWYRRTALSDLLQLGDEEVNKDRLYRGLDHLLAHKAALEAHLSKRCGELFAVQNEVLLYDVTSTYFEGQAEANPQAQRGYSRDHRPDCKQVCIALVVTFDGFPLGYTKCSPAIPMIRGPCRRSWPPWRPGMGRGQGLVCWRVALGLRGNVDASG